ncbi:unnamed protein product [Lathyrus oleraceus]
MEEVDLQRFRSAFIRVAEQSGMTYNVQEAFHTEGYFLVKVTSLGAFNIEINDNTFRVKVVEDMHGSKRIVVPKQNHVGGGHESSDTEVDEETELEEGDINCFEVVLERENGIEKQKSCDNNQTSPGEEEAETLGINSTFMVKDMDCVLELLV